MFEMPDYKTVGRLLSTQLLSRHFDDPPVYDLELDDILLEPESYRLVLPELGLRLIALVAIQGLLTRVL